MNVQQKNKQSGFTIIEVVLVLAIAGLIFLMVFIALPALQRSQRDAQRRDDVSRMVSQLQSYATNNRGNLPGSDDITRFINDYMKTGEGEFRDPLTGNDYTVTNASQDAQTGRIQYVPGRECNGENLGGSAGPRQAAVRIQLEGSGYFCQNVQ